MSALKELATVATKIAVDSALKGKNAVKETISSAAAVSVGTAAEKIAKKTGLLKDNGLGELVLKVPYFKTTERKIKRVLEEHPERRKVCFHLQESLRDGVVFYNPMGNEVYRINTDKKNLKQAKLYENGKYVGRIEKHITININPFADLQKYDAVINGLSGTIRVERLDASVDFAPWRLKHKRGGSYAIEQNEEKEIGKVYSLGNCTFVIDFIETVDPVGIILAFIAIKMRREEVKRNHQHGYKGSLWIDEAIADIKDIF